MQQILIRLQTVISGNTAEIELAEERCKDHGAKRAIRLNVSVASHSELMRDQQIYLAQSLKRLILEVHNSKSIKTLMLYPIQIII
ncbi:MAG: hypothetical protein CM15mP17_11930 [Gammaproteobacteria bacterium]|nr:MAG: hypothetical protein CM15mP17_11930 [Gammaproteobacteria bacterium]